MSMNTSTLIEQLRQHPDVGVRFVLPHGREVAGEYNITEIKQAEYQTIDCGNSLHVWSEVVVQVLAPSAEKAAGALMPSGKFLRIWETVASRLELKGDAEMRFEYGDAHLPTVSYQVSEVEITADTLTIHWVAPRTMCKPREALRPFGTFIAETADIAQTKSRPEQVIPLMSGSGACCG